MSPVLNALLKAKLKAALGSSTMGVAGALMLAATWVGTHPDIVATVAPQWGGTITALAGLAVAVARARSL